MQPAVQAEETIREYSSSGTQMDPDYYYELTLAMTNDEKQARRAQAELMFNQMANS